MAAFELRLYAHRGASLELPENTLEAFQRAVELGADALETDLHLTKDGRVVLAHDPDGLRMAGEKRLISACTFAEVRAWNVGERFVDRDGRRPFAGRRVTMPTLHELLDACPGVRLNVDLKPRRPRMVEAVLKLLRDRGAEERVTLASFHSEPLAELRARGYRGELALSAREVLTLAAMPAWLPGAHLAVRGHAVQIPPRRRLPNLASPRFIARCHALALRVDYWVIDEPAEAQALLERGADGIMTNDPARLAGVMKRARPTR